MTRATGRFVTGEAPRYARQLCRHFAHKPELAVSEDRGEIRFPYGTATLAASADALDVRLEAATAEDLATLRDVVERHLLRFAFREGDRGVDWAA